MSYLIVFPTALEADTFLSSQPVKKSQGLYQFKKGYAVISGMGSYKTLSTLYDISLDFQEIWGVGIAGALNPNLELGALYTINRVGKLTPSLQETSEHGISLFSSLHPDFSVTTPTESKRASLVTSDFPIYNKEMTERLSSAWDLVDMESYALAYYCYEKGVIYKGLKAVSDFAQAGGEKLIRKHLQELSQKLSEELSSLLLL